MHSDRKFLVITGSTTERAALERGNPGDNGDKRRGNKLLRRVWQSESAPKLGTREDVMTFTVTNLEPCFVSRRCQQTEVDVHSLRARIQVSRWTQEGYLPTLVMMR